MTPAEFFLLAMKNYQTPVLLLHMLGYIRTAMNMFIVVMNYISI